MPDLVEQMYCSQQIIIPPNLPSILKKYAKAAIRTQPLDLLVWSSAYFRALSEGTPPPVKDRIEYPPVQSESGLSPGFLKLGKVENVSKTILVERWRGVCLNESFLESLISIGGFDEDVDWMKFIAIAAGSIEPNLTRTMILLCEILTVAPDGENPYIESDLFIDLYTYLAKLDCGPEDFTKKQLNMVLEEASCETIDDKNMGEEDYESKTDQQSHGGGEIVTWDAAIADQQESIEYLDKISEPEDTGEGNTEQSDKNIEDGKINKFEFTNKIILENKEGISNENIDIEKETDESGEVENAQEPNESGEVENSEEPLEKVEVNSAEESIDNGEVENTEEPIESGEIENAEKSMSEGVENIEEPIESGEVKNTEEPIESSVDENPENPIEGGEGENAEDPIESGEGELAEEPVESGEVENAEEPIESGEGENAEEPIEGGEVENTEEPVESGEVENAEELIESGEGENAEEPVDCGEVENTEEPVENGEVENAKDSETIAEETSTGPEDSKGEILRKDSGYSVVTFKTDHYDPNMVFPNITPGAENWSEVNSPRDSDSGNSLLGVQVWDENVEAASVYEMETKGEKRSNDDIPGGESEATIDVDKESLKTSEGLEEEAEITRESTKVLAEGDAEEQDMFAPAVESMQDILMDTGVEEEEETIASESQKNIDKIGELFKEEEGEKSTIEESQVSSEATGEIFTELVPAEDDFNLLPTPVMSEMSVLVADGTNMIQTEDERFAYSQKLAEKASMANVAIISEEPTVKEEERFIKMKEPFWMYLPGIGPVVPLEIIDAAVDYFKTIAPEQANTIMPRNLRHYRCPPLHPPTEQCDN